MTRSLLLILALLMVACGGPSRSTETARSSADDEEDEDDYVDEEEEDDGDDRDDSGFIDDALRRSASVEPITLGELASIPGSGVSLRPPSGAVPMPFGGGFLSMTSRVQISVVVAEGDESVLEDIRTGGNPEAPEPQESAAHTVSGREGRIGRDQIEGPQGTLERMWLLVHDGSRGLGVVATYEADRGPVFRPGLQQMFESVEWDREAQLDASETLGIHVGPVRGLELSRRSTANVVLTAPNAPFPPEAGQVVITVLPLPMQIPPDQVQAACGQLTARLMPVPDESVESEGTIDDGQLPGCERLATARTREGESVIAYAAVLFNAGMPIFMSASAAAEEGGTWSPRFASAARTVRMRGGDDD